jgi:toxin ParE1/3/4
MTIVWSVQSQDDLREIRKFIARDAPDTASAYIRRLRKSVSRLRSFPEAGVVVTEAANSRIREIYFGQYRIIYELASSRIDILTVYHSARLLDDTEF